MLAKNVPNCSENEFQHANLVQDPFSEQIEQVQLGGEQCPTWRQLRSKEASYAACMLEAWLPLGPCVTSKDTFWPSLRVLGFEPVHLDGRKMSE